jgi:hypothetical protein
LGFHCRWSSSVFGVLLSLEFYRLHTLAIMVVAPKVALFNSSFKMLLK